MGFTTALSPILSDRSFDNIDQFLQVRTQAVLRVINSLYRFAKLERKPALDLFKFSGLSV